MNVVLARPDPGNERFGLGPFFRVEPLGLEYVGPGSEARGGKERVVGRRFGRRVDRALRSAPVVGISCMHALEYDRAVETAREIRRVAPQALVVFGGHAAASYPGPLEVPEADAICMD